MCITVWPAKLGGTLLYAGEGDFGGKRVHVLAYQNKAASEGPNAMILPIPSAAPLDERNAIDTRQFREFLEIIQQANEKIPPELVGARCRPDEPPPAKVFDVGSYTVVMAAGAAAISAALDQVPAEKRPPDNNAMFAAFEEHYPGWPLAVCCWNGEIEAEPLLWWYEPLDPDWIFAPALDAHDGGPPKLDADVEVEHYLAFGASKYSLGNRLGYFSRRDVPEAVLGLLPWSVHGTRVEGKMPNGDFWVPAASLARPAIRRSPGRNSSTFEIPLDGWSRDWSGILGQ
jgi:hypothetical protein